MGDVLSLIEKVGEDIDEEKAKEMSQKLKKAQFDFEDYLESMKQMCIRDSVSPNCAGI